MGFWSGCFSFSPFSQTLFLSFSSLSSLCPSHPFLSTTPLTLGCHHFARPKCGTMGECTCQSTDKTQSMEQEEPVHPQPKQAFLEGTLFQPRFRRKKDTWCDMTHSVIYYQAWVRWLLCNDTVQKPFHFLNALHSVHTWQHMSTPRNWLSWQEHIGFDTHKTVPHI